MKKTKAQLEKENAKLEKQLEFYKNACKHQPEEKPLQLQNVQRDVCVQKEPIFATITNQLTEQLKTQQDYMDSIISRISTIDGGIHFEPYSQDKVYRNGVCGVLEQLMDMAKENRSRTEIINNRLAELVG